MDRDLIIDVGKSEVSIALMENRRLIELNKERLNTDHYTVGDVHLGKVHKIMPNLNAAFVDIGDEKDAFIHYLDLSLNYDVVRDFTQKAMSREVTPESYGKMSIKCDILPKEGKIADVLKPGQVIMVQIAKEPISTKGARLTTEISLAGRNMVLMPFSEKVNISSKITAREERKRLERLFYSILPQNYGLIVRTAAEGKRSAVLDEELHGLIKKWESSWPLLVQAKAPMKILTENSRITTVLRDLLNDSFTSIQVNNAAAYEEVLQYVNDIAPEKASIVKLYKERKPIFEALDVARQIRSAFGRIVALRQGVYLIIEHTEALHVVDVNSGVRAKMGNTQENNAFEVNMIAAEELARQLRLRDMGGIIIVDFIDMDLPEHKQQLFRRMQELMATDRAKHTVLPLTKFGLMQITRQRVRPVMEIDTNETCPTCRGTGKITSTWAIEDEIDECLERLAKGQQHSRLTLKTHPFVAAYLNKGLLGSKVAQWRKKYKIKLKVVDDIDLAIVQFKWIDAQGQEIKDA